MAPDPPPRPDEVAPRPGTAEASLTLSLDAAGQWHATVVLQDGRWLEFSSPFELARWSRAAVPSARRLPQPGAGLR